MTSGGNLPIPKALTRARPLLAAPVAVLLFAATYVQAADPNLLRSANRALAEAIPQVAIEKLRTFLAAPDLTPEDRHKAEALLVEGMLSANLVDEALLATDSFTKSTSPRLRLLRAHALAATGRWSEALPIYRQLAAAPDAPLAPKLGEAECLHALGQTGRASELIEGLVRRGDAPVGVQLRHASLLVELRQEKRGWAALNAIQPITPEEKKWQHYVEGQLALLQDRPDAARLSFESVLRDESHLSENLHVGATLGIAEARMALQGSEAGEKVLETFIWAHPHSAYLELAFRRLDQIYAMQERASEDDLHGWVKKPEARRSALARFYVARLQIRKKKPDKAAQSLQAFVRDHPGHPLLPYVHLTQADLLLEKGDNPGALAALEAAARQVTTDELRADVELRTAFVHFRRSEYLLAANTFQRAAQRSPRLRESSLFNAALSTLNLKNFERFLTEFTELSQRYPESPLRSELMLEQGLLQARLKDPRAAETLQLFLHHFPRAPRVAEAHLALAELVFEGRSDGDGARYLRAANTLPSAPEIGAHADYLAIFAADRQTPRDDSTVVRLAEEFIQAHAGSPLLPEVRMKLGEVQFRRDDFGSAEAQFAAVARENAASAYTETALFLAGQAAMQTINKGAVDRALEFFDQVVKRRGHLELFARQQQALVQSRLGREREAITLYELILAAQPPAEPELRYAAYCGKGDNLLALGAKESKQLDAAIAVFEQLAAFPDVPPSWRNQALYKKARALEQLGRTNEALVAFYDVLEPAGMEREFFWFYKAGFDAARIFESQQQWKPAIGIYQKMAKAEGPRSAEASSRMKKLRLEHFIWD